MEFVIEVDSRERCDCLVNPDSLSQTLEGLLRIVDTEVVISVQSDKSIVSGRLRMSKDFAACLNMISGSVITCTKPLALSSAVQTPIVISPASVDDWEVVESHAVYLESNILSQIRVVSPGMKFPVWIGRGQKPVVLQVSSHIGGEYRVLTEDTELAVEARVREEVDVSRHSSRKFLPLRVVDSGFPDITTETSLLGVGLIVNTEDFVTAFGSESGCLVTVRDRPDILTIVACDSSLVDPGVALVSPCMRDMYQLHSGERIIIEEQEEDVNKNLVSPKKVIVSFPSEVAERKRSRIFQDFLHSANCIVVPQGGWLEIPLVGYVRVQFECPDKFSTSQVGAILGKNQSEIYSFEFPSLPVSDLLPNPPRPYLKYVPSIVKEDAIATNSIYLSHKIFVPEKPLPSFDFLVKRIASFIDAGFTRASPTHDFVGSLLLLSQSVGAGRTTVVRQAIASLTPPVQSVVVDCAALASSERYKLADVKATISGLVRFAFESPPCILMLDNVDRLVPPVTKNLDSESTVRAEKRGISISNFLIDLMHTLKPNRSLVILGTAVNDSPALARIFAHSERLPPKLTMNDRKFLVPSISGEAEQYSLLELVELRNTGSDNRDVRRRLLAGGKNEVLKTTNRIGGMHAQRQILIDAISLPLKFPFLFPAGLMSTGAFVVGPSGCGKSALVDAVVSETGLPVEIVRGPDLLDKYIGASEQAVRRVFEKAASIAPCVVVFDTIDALCPRRGSESTGVTDRVVNQMLCYLDGVEKLENVFVIAISSRPDMVDPALVRPGRLDLVVICDAPTEQEKRDIIQKLAHDMCGLELAESEVDTVVKSVHVSCTGADIKSGFVNAKIQASRDKSTVTVDFLVTELGKVKPSLSPKDLIEKDRILDKFRASKSTPTENSNIGSRVMLH